MAERRLPRHTSNNTNPECPCLRVTHSHGSPNCYLLGCPPRPHRGCSLCHDAVDARVSQVDRTGPSGTSPETLSNDRGTYLGTKMELCRKFSKTLRYSASSFSACFSASVLGHAQHGPFSPPHTSVLGFSVTSSMSKVPPAYFLMGILSARGREAQRQCPRYPRARTRTGHRHLSSGTGLLLPRRASRGAGNARTVGSRCHRRPPPGHLLTFRAVIVPVQVAVLRLSLPPHDVVAQVAVGQRGGVPLHDQLGRGVRRGQNVQGDGRNWNGEKEGMSENGANPRRTAPDTQCGPTGSQKFGLDGQRAGNVETPHENRALRRNGIHVKRQRFPLRSLFSGDLCGNKYR